MLCRAKGSDACLSKSAVDTSLMVQWRERWERSNYFRRIAPLTNLPKPLPDIYKIIVELVDPALPHGLWNQGKIEKRADTSLITSPLARTGFDCHFRDWKHFETLIR